MKALQFDRTGDLAALSFTEIADPVPATDEVLVEVHAAGLNPSDVKNVLGRFPYTTLPRVPGRDLPARGERPDRAARQIRLGHRQGPGLTRNGSHAQLMSVPLGGVALMPERMSFAQAASCGVPFTTAWDALERSQVGKGTRLLVIGSGAVGAAAISLAKARGAQVLGAVRRAESQVELQAQGIPSLLLDSAETLAAQVDEHFPGGAR